MGPQLDVISNDSTDVLSQFGHSRRRIEIIIDLIDSNNVGLYTCMAISHSNNVTVSRGYELIAQGMHVWCMCPSDPLMSVRVV